MGVVKHTGRHPVHTVLVALIPCRTVDPLSFARHAQPADDSDDRVQLALGELKEHFPMVKGPTCFENTLPAMPINSY